MYPEDRVLVGVINTQRDLVFAREAGWYRIPYTRMPLGVDVEYIAFFVSGSVLKTNRGQIAYYARRGGVELARRRDLVPSQPHHARADALYYRISLVDFQEKVPPIVNAAKRAFSFIHTTWDRFVQAQGIRDLYQDDVNLTVRTYYKAGPHFRKGHEG